MMTPREKEFWVLHGVEIGRDRVSRNARSAAEGLVLIQYDALLCCLPGESYHGLC